VGISIIYTRGHFTPEGICNSTVFGMPSAMQAFAISRFRSKQVAQCLDGVGQIQFVCRVEDGGLRFVELLSAPEVSRLEPFWVVLQNFFPSNVEENVALNF